MTSTTVKLTAPISRTSVSAAARQLQLQLLFAEACAAFLAELDPRAEDVAQYSRAAREMASRLGPACVDALQAETRLTHVVAPALPAARTRAAAAGA